MDNMRIIRRYLDFDSLAIGAYFAFVAFFRVDRRWWTYVSPCRAESLHDWRHDTLPPDLSPSRAWLFSAPVPWQLSWKAAVGYGELEEKDM